MQPVMAARYNWATARTWPGDAVTSPAVTQTELTRMDATDCSTPPPTKRCTRCGQDHPFAAMIRNARSKDGYGSRCKTCHNAWNREIAMRDPEATRAYEREKARRLYRADPDKFRARHRQWYAENRAHCVEYATQWARDNPEKHKANERAYGRRHSARIVQRVKAWQTANPDRMRDHRRRTKALRRGAGEARTFDRNLIWERDGGRCHICGKRCAPDAWHLDHLIPLSRGGAHTPENVAVSHPTCNVRRHNTGPAQLRMWGDI